MTKSIPTEALSSHKPSRDPKSSTLILHPVTPTLDFQSCSSAFPGRKTYSFLPSSDGYWKKVIAHTERFRRFIRRLLNLYHSFTLSQRIKANWNTLRWTAYNTVDFSPAVYFLDNLIIWKTIIICENGSLSYRYLSSWGRLIWDFWYAVFSKILRPTSALLISFCTTIEMWALWFWIRLFTGLILFVQMLRIHWEVISSVGLSF